MSIHEVSMSFLKILFNYCFPWRPSDLSGEGLPYFRGLSEVAEGPPLPVSLKILLNFCFSWGPADLKKRRAVSKVPYFTRLLKKRRVQGRSPADVHS